MSSRSGRGKRKLHSHSGGNGFEEWGGYMQAKIQKLQEQFQEENPEAGGDGLKSNIFKKVAIFVNGYTRPSSSELKTLMTQHGGTYHHYYQRLRVTHIIASNLPNSKVMNLTDKKVVRPDWITDSIEAGRLLSHEPYLLYTSRSKLQPGLKKFASNPGANALVESNNTNPADTLTSESGANNVTSDCVTSETPYISESNSESHVEGDKDGMMEGDSNESEVSVEEYPSPPQPSLANTSLSKPSSSHPSPAQPIQTQPSSSHPSPAQPLKTQPSSSHPSPAQPSSTKPSPAQPPPTKPSQAQPSSSHPSPAQPSSTKPSPAHPPPTKPTPAQHPSTKPSQAQPSSTRQQGYKHIGDARDPKFLSEFYSNSRLHHISMWGAEYKAYVSRLQAEGGTSFPGRERLRALVSQRESDVPAPGRPPRVIMHVDMDCFFVSVGLRKRPDLRDKPVAVTHSRGKGPTTERPGTDLSKEAAHYRKRGLKLRRGPGKGQLNPALLDTACNPDLLRMTNTSLEEDDEEEGEDVPTRTTAKGGSATASESFRSMADIASCNYEARKAGVHNGMSMGPAKSLCPNLQTIPYDFEGYQEVSKILYDTVASFTHDIEAVSCDEMFVDCTDLLADTGATPAEMAELLRGEIRAATDCNASVGIGPNILLARLATRVAKPNGLFELKETEAKEFLKDRSVSDLPGVGRAMVNKLSVMKVSTCGDLQEVSLGVLQRELGAKTGQALYRACRGHDPRAVKPDQQRKSVSAEVNYGIRFTSEADVVRFIRELSEEVHSRLDKLNVKGKTITLKLKVRAEGAPKETAKFMGHGICNNITKSATIPMATDNPEVIAKECMGIIHTLRVPPDEYRGVGISMSRLEAPVQRGGLSKGHQSILNFSTKPTVNSSLNKSASKSPDTSTGKSPDKSFTGSTGGGSPSGLGSIRSPVSTTSSKPIAEPAISPPPASAQPNGALATQTPADTRQQSEPTGKRLSTQADSSVESVRPVSGPSRVKVNLPPLPTLPNFTSPPPAGPTTTTTDLLLPSPSQVDPSVLSELPPDLRGQIEGELAACSRRAEARPSGDRGTGGNQQRPQEGPATSRQDDPIVALPSFSQVDPSCLEALPPELRAELIRAYGRDQPEVREPPATRSTHPLMQAKTSPKRSPGKRSPGNKGKGSPGFKKPRGRGPGRPRKELNFGKTTNVTATKKAPAKETQKKREDTPAPKVSSVCEPSTSSGVGSSREPTIDHGTTNQEAATEPTGVNLCGAVTLTEVKGLLKEWTLHCDEPEQEDVDHLTQYLYDLVLDHNLEQLDLVLKYFRRCLRNRKMSANWEKAYGDVLNQAQVIIQSLYGSRLKM